MKIFQIEPWPLPREALVFQTKNNSAFRKGAIVQLVGFGRSEPEDDPEDTEGVFIWAQPVFLDEMDGGPDIDYWPESWRYFREDLKPLTPAAHAVMRLAIRQHDAFLLRRNR